MKKTVATGLVLLAALVSAGCVETSEFKIEPVALAKKVPEAPPIQLDQILADNSAAIAFAGEKKDFLQEDKYLAYVADAKERDAVALSRATAQALQAAVDQTQANLNSQTEQSSSNSTQQTNTNSGSQPSSGGSSSGSSGSGGQTSSSARYYNTALGYSIEFPAGWAQIDSMFADLQLVAAVSPPSGAGDQFLENIGVAVQELPLELSSDEYLDMSVAGLKAGMQDFQEINRSDFTLDGRSGKKLVFSYTLDGKTMKDALYEVVKGLKAYVIIATAEASRYSDDEDIFDASAGTFKFETSP